MIVSGVLPISKVEKARSVLRIEVKTLLLPCLQASSARTRTHMHTHSHTCTHMHTGNISY